MKRRDILKGFLAAPLIGKSFEEAQAEAIRNPPKPRYLDGWPGLREYERSRRDDAMMMTGPALTERGFSACAFSTVAPSRYASEPFEDE